MKLTSLLDTDLYKLTQQWAVLSKFPNSLARYRWINRSPKGDFTQEYVERLSDIVKAMSYLSVSHKSTVFLAKKCPFLPPQYLSYLQNYRYNPNQVKIGLIDGELSLEIEGLWHETILWEVPLMAAISELYYSLIDTDWNYDNQEEFAESKLESLQNAGCVFSEFGTRRRRTFFAQDIIFNILRKSSNCIGTSNVHFAEKYDCLPVGTVAHEWFQAISALVGLRHVNQFALDIWNEVYKGSLGIALTDTFGTNAFFEDFNLNRTKLWDGLRQDSGDPFSFTDRTVDHYVKHRVNSKSKIILYSNNLHCPYVGQRESISAYQDATKIQFYAVNKVIPRFGIGTFFTNDFPKKSDPKFTSPALNMVIKLVEIDGIPVVKLSDDPSKSMGDASALKVAKWMFFGEQI